MSMLVRCPNCQKTLKVPDTVAGKKIRCPACSGVVDVPRESGGAPASTTIQSPKDAGLSAESSPAIRKARSVSRESSSAAVPAKPATASLSPSTRPASGPKGTTPPDPKRATSSTGRPDNKSTSAAKPPKRPKPDEYADAYEEDYDSHDGEEDYDDGYDSVNSNPFAPPKTRAGSAASRPTSHNEAASRSLAGMGLLIQGWATVSVFMMLLFMLGVGFLLGGRTSGPPPQGFLALIGLSGIGMFVAAIAVLIGECLCLSIPERSGAKGLIIAAVSLLALQVVLSVMQVLLTESSSPTPFQAPPFRQNLSAGQLFFSLLGLLTGIGHIVCFELFLRKASQYVRRDDLAKQAMTILIGIPSCLVAIFVCSFVAPLLGFYVAPVLALIMLIPLIAAGIGLIVLAVMHVALLFKVGAALRA